MERLAPNVTECPGGQRRQLGTPGFGARKARPPTERHQPPPPSSASIRPVMPDSDNPSSAASAAMTLSVG